MPPLIQLQHAMKNFKIEINSLEDFIVFVSIIRGEDLPDIKKIKALTTELNTDSNILQKAIDSQKEK